MKRKKRVKSKKPSKKKIKKRKVVAAGISKLRFAIKKRPSLVKIAAVTFFILSAY